MKCLCVWGSDCLRSQHYLGTLSVSKGMRRIRLISSKYLLDSFVWIGNISLLLLFHSLDSSIAFKLSLNYLFPIILVKSFAFETLLKFD